MSCQTRPFPPSSSMWVFFAYEIRPCRYLFSNQQPKKGTRPLSALALTPVGAGARVSLHHHHRGVAAHGAVKHLVHDRCPTLSGLSACTGAAAKQDNFLPQLDGELFRPTFLEDVQSFVRALGLSPPVLLRRRGRLCSSGRSSGRLHICTQ